LFVHWEAACSASLFFPLFFRGISRNGVFGGFVLVPLFLSDFLLFFLFKKSRIYMDSSVKKVYSMYILGTVLLLLVDGNNQKHLQLVVTVLCR
jgi:hypothetical protein